MIEPSSLHLKQKRPGGLRSTLAANAERPLPVHLLRDISRIASMTALIGGAEAIYRCAEFPGW